MLFSDLQVKDNIHGQNVYGKFNLPTLITLPSHNISQEMRNSADTCTVY